MYGSDALRQLREQQAQATEHQEHQPSAFDGVPLDAPYDKPEQVLHAWDGHRFVPYNTWLVRQPFRIVPLPEGTRPTFPPETDRVVAVCGGTRIWLVREVDRWLMYVGSQKNKGRRRDFASPSLEHAMATAERWYGAPGDGWRPEVTRDGTRTEAADLPAEDSTAA